ncbi:carcinine transporter-like [Macrobrachium nipponense]|uniref:carcinine transporter-like n=1 Tax=Macrobrachium nipponense TaxID=159736 RepID=UPI0030C8135F
MSTPVFEQLLEEVGDTGKHQQLLFWLYVVPINFLIPWIALVPIFMTSTPSHWCHVPGQPPELTDEQWKKLTIPKEITDGEESFSQCQQYNVTWDDLSSLNLTDIDSLVPTFNQSYGIIGCQAGWDYDHTDYDSTLSIDQNWVCDSTSLAANWQSIGVAGNVIGTFIFNTLSDLLGRRPVFVVAVMIFAVFGIVRLYVTSYMWIMTTMLLASLSFPAVLELPLIIVMEQVSPTWRARITSTSFLLWTAGMCFLPLIAWLARDWVVLGLITTIPFFVFVLAWWILPESPRWLLSRNRLDETASLLRSIALRNGRPVPEKLEQNIQSIALLHNNEKNYGALQLFKYRKVCIRTILLTACYTCNNLFYYGLAYNTTNLSGNEFLNFFLLGITELPSNILAWLGADFIGRRWTESGCSFLAAIFALAAAFTIAAESWVRISILLLSKMFITMSFMVVYVQCAEIYPTTHRASGTGFSSLVSSCFGTTAPFIAYVHVHGEWVPYTILFAIGIIGFICGSLLPETLNADLPQSLMDASNFLPSEKFFSYKGKHLWSKKVKVSPQNGQELGQDNPASLDNDVDSKVH